MSFYENIKSDLSKQLNRDKARLDCMTSLVQGILFTRNINPSRIAASNDMDYEPKATEESRYQRFQCFFSYFKIPIENIARDYKKKPKGRVDVFSQKLVLNISKR